MPIGNTEIRPLDGDDSRRDRSASPKRRRLAPAPSSQIARATQRAPKSCLECTRRKIKCDKQQPCESCITRGEGYLCRREPVIYKGSIISGNPAEGTHSINNLVTEVADLRERVIALERSLGNDQTSHLSRTGQASRSGTGPSSPIRHDTDFDQYKLPGTMEEFALGIGETTRWKGASLLIASNVDSSPNNHPWYQSIPHLSTISSLPSRPVCTSLLGYYLDELSWMTCAVHGPTLIAEHARFWDDYEETRIRDDPWLACLFAVLSLSAFFMDEAQATMRGFSLQQLRPIASTWFDCSIATLYRCSLTTAPTLLTCQTIQVLGPAFHLSGNTTLHQSMTAMEHVQMRLINLHLLGEGLRDGDEESLSKEMGRRVWWNGIESNWGFLPYYRYTRKLIDEPD